MQKKKLLLIIPDIPYPQRKNGLSIRYYPILKRLSASYDMDCIFTLQNKPEKNELDGISNFFNKIEIILDNSKVSFLKKLVFFISRFNPFAAPHSLYSYQAKQNAKLIFNYYHTNDYSKVIFVTLRNSHALKYVHKLGLNKNNIVIDVIDSLSLHFSRSKSKNNNFILRKYKLFQSLNWEAQTISYCSEAMYISQKDYSFVSSKLSNNNNLHVVPNGVYIEGYHQKSIELSNTPSIGFLGSMGYPPNIKGALFAYDILKSYREKFGPLKYYIIGREPIDSIKKLGDDPDVIVTGTVDDIWEYVNTVDIFIVHLFDGAGQQNKLLEVMYAGKPVIANDISNAGISGKHNEHLLLSDSKELCLQQLNTLINNKALGSELGENAQQYIKNTFSWESCFNLYLRIIQLESTN